MFRSACTFLIILCWVLAPSCYGESLSYQWSKNPEVGYAFRVEAEVDDVIRQVQGVTIYRASKGAASSSSGETGSATGTGFVVTKDGYIVTCAHVVSGTSKIEVILGGKTYTATTIATNDLRDLAVIKIKGKNLPTVPLADSDKLQLAQEVRAVGFPLASVLGSSVKITRGSIAGFVKKSSSRRVLQVDASINPGNSGGPIINDQGQVVGIASAKLVDDDVTNVGFAVPVNDVRKLLSEKQVSVPKADEGEKLDGPALARKVTPAVCYIKVTIGPTASENYVLTARGSQTTRTLNKSRRMQPGTVAETEDFENVKVKVNHLGEIDDAEDAPSLPFSLGSQAMVGIESMPEAGDETWGHQVKLSLAQMVPREAKGFGGAPFRDWVRVRVPVEDRLLYRLGNEKNDAGFAEITKQMLIKATGGTVDLNISGKGTLQFDMSLGLSESLVYAGTMSVETGSSKIDIPIKYTYMRLKSTTGSLASLIPRDHQWPGDSGGSKTPQERKALPDAAGRTAGENIVKELFGDKMKAARTIAQKQALAGEFRTIALDDETLEHSFVILNHARKLATQAQDVELVLAIVDDMVRLYETDRGRFIEAALRELSAAAKNPTQNKAIATRAVEISERALAEGDMATVLLLGKVAHGAAKESNDRNLVDRVLDVARRYQEIKRSGDQLQAALDVLAQNPTDPLANHNAGTYFCFVDDKWDRGLPMLTKGTDEKIRDAAKKDLAATSDAGAGAAAGDAWWALADASNSPHVAAMRQRAVHWYRQAIGKTSGIAKLRIEKRLEKAGELLASASSDVDDKPGPTKRPHFKSSSAQRIAARKKLIEFAGQVVKAKTAGRSKEVGFTLGKTEFWIAPEEGGVLIGFDVSIGTFNKIVGLRPIFHTASGKVPGPLVGSATSKNARFVARDGYAVGGLSVRSGIGIDGLSITFFEMGEKGLNSANQYSTNWLGGGHSSRSPTVLGGDGSPIIGIYGHRDAKIMGLGVVTAPVQE